MQPAPTFQWFGAAHVCVLAATVALAIGLVRATRWIRIRKLPLIIAWTVAAVLVMNEIVNYAVLGAEIGAWGLLENQLPLHICGVAMYLTVLTLLTRRQGVFEVAFYWGLIGAPVALLLPDLHVGVAEYWFWQFFIRHAFIVVGVLYAVFGLGMRPRPGSALRVFALTNLWLLIVAGLNVLLGANYMYVSHLPRLPGLLAQAPWPWYVLVADVALGAAFVLLGRVSCRPTVRSRSPSPAA